MPEAMTTTVTSVCLSGCADVTGSSSREFKFLNPEKISLKISLYSPYIFL